MDQALRIVKVPRDIAWYHDPRCHPLRCCLGATTWDVNPLWHCLVPRPKISSFATLLGSCDLRCQPSVTLLGTTPQDVTLCDIAQEKWLNMSKCLRHYLGATTRGFACKLFFFLEICLDSSKIIIFGFCPIHDSHKYAKNGSCRHFILFEFVINKVQST